MQFTVGMRLRGKSEHIVIDAEDALIAALKVKVFRTTAQLFSKRFIEALTPRAMAKAAA